MSLDRRTIRLVFPPLAAAVLVALTITPSLAGTDITLAPRSTDSAALPGTGARPAQPTTTAGGNVVVGVPAVAFTATVTTQGSHLRTPVLINIAEVPGRVTVIGAGQGADCRADAQPGVVLWLDCTVNTRAAKNPRIVVTLMDGRRVEKSVDMHG